MTRMGRLVEWSGFGNGRGHFSFNKLVTFTALWVFAFATYLTITQLRQIPPWYMWSFGVAIIGAGFGLKGYLGYIKQRTESLSAATNTNLSGDLAQIAKVVIERRDAETGVDPT